MSLQASKPRILFVDDDEQQLKTYRRLMHRDFSIRVASSGREALSRIEQEEPFSVLVSDMQMPGMDGIELLSLAQRLAPDSSRILLTGFPTLERAMQAVNHGQIFRFLSKPCSKGDLKAALNAGLEQHRLRTTEKRLMEELRRSNAELESARSLQNHLSRMIVHDLKSPLTSLIRDLERLSTPNGRPRRGPQPKALKRSLSSAWLLSEMVDSILDLERLRSGEWPLQMERYDLRGLIRVGLEITLGSCIEPERFQQELPDGPVPVTCDSEVVRRLVANLVASALDRSPPEGGIQIRVAVRQQSAWVEVEDQAMGIPSPLSEEMFHAFEAPYATACAERGASSIGLAFCRMAAEAMGGAVGARRTGEVGNVLWLKLPLDQGATHAA